MVRRAGLGATTASAVIFSIILIANFSVYYASQGRERSYSQANLADSLYDGGLALEGSEATNVLLRLQAYLGGGPFDCYGALDSVAAGVPGLGEARGEGAVTSRVAVALATGGPTADNLSLVAPYNGYAPGRVSLALRFSIAGGVAAAGVSYTREETHFVSLPVRLESLSRDCTGALSEMEAVLKASSVANCTSSDVSPLVASAARGPESAASLDGFDLGVTYMITGQSPCSVSLGVTIVQGDIQGPAGDFSVELRGTGSASLG